MSETTGVPDSASAERISKLERQAMRLRIGVLAALIFAVVSLYQAAIASNRLDQQAQSNAVEILGKNGRIAARLGIQPDGATGLVLSDGKGKLRLSLLVRPDGSPRLDLFGEGMKKRVVVGFKPDGTPVLETEGAEAEPPKKP